MALVTCEEMKALEEAVFSRGVEPEDLMDLAGRRLGRFVDRFYAGQGTVVAYLGKGNNGGDALVALRVLRERGWVVLVRSGYHPEELGGLPQKKLKELGVTISRELPEDPSELPRPLVLLDGLVGIGARGGLREPLAQLAKEMNRLRAWEGARTVAVDLPSGLNADTGEVQEPTVTADVTCTLGVGKSGLVADGATDRVGRLELIPLKGLAEPEQGSESLLTALSLRSSFPPRPFSSHKGSVGRVAVLAGSSNYVGAAVLAATGALKGGAGLVTLYLEEGLFPVIRAAGLPPEVIVRSRSELEDLSSQKHDALVVGPGLGEFDDQGAKKLLGFLKRWQQPSVVDADALNLIARQQAWDVLGGHTVLTPHPGEMKRLLGSFDDPCRRLRARELARRSGATVLYKGARTVVTNPDGHCYFNTSGTPAMATGGQGDLLSGLLGALLATGMNPLRAACGGAWLCGRAAEVALAEGMASEESLLPSDVARSLGRAFDDLRGRI